MCAQQLAFFSSCAVAVALQIEFARAQIVMRGAGEAVSIGSRGAPSYTRVSLDWEIVRTAFRGANCIRREESRVPREHQVSRADLICGLRGARGRVAAKLYQQRRGPNCPSATLTNGSRFKSGRQTNDRHFYSYLLVCKIAGFRPLTLCVLLGRIDLPS